eukprot:jgi/Picsp_1/268/NSC_00267-R1_---NA---
MDAYGVEATSETQKWRRKDPEIDPKEKEHCMNGKGDRLMKRPPGHLARIDSLLIKYCQYDGRAV